MSMCGMFRTGNIISGFIQRMKLPEQLHDS